MKQLQKITFSLSLILSVLTTGAAMAIPTSPVGTVLFAVFNSPSLDGRSNVFGGVIFRHVQYDSSHFIASMAGAFRITPNGTTSGLSFDQGEVVLRFTRGGSGNAYGECTMRRVFNDDFDHFVSVKLAERSPNSNAGENIIVPISISATGKSRSFVSESVAFSTDNFNYVDKANDGICNTNVFGNPIVFGIPIVEGIPDIQVGDVVDVYILNTNNPAHVATAVMLTSNI